MRFLKKSNKAVDLGFRVLRQSVLQVDHAKRQIRFHDTGTPVSEDYKVPFRFTGEIEKVTLKLQQDDHGRSSPAMDPVFGAFSPFPQRGDALRARYWTSTSSAYAESFAWRVDFTIGYTSTSPKGTIVADRPALVWAVRGGR